VEVIPDFGAPSFLDRIQYIFVQINGSLKKAIGELTWEEAEALFKKHDVWHCRVNMPCDALAYKQAAACHTFIGDPMAGPVLISTPVQLSSNSYIPRDVLPKLEEA